MLQAGVGAYNTGLSTSRGASNLNHIDLEIELFESFENRGVIQDADSTVVLVTVSERELSCRTGDTITPCRSLAAAQNVIKRNPKLRVFLVPISNKTSMTGVDVVAGLVSGISGVVDERGLVMQEIIGEIVRHRSAIRNSRSMLLIGELTSEVKSMKEMIDEWDLDAEADPTLDLASWRAALALAQLEKLEIVIGTGHATSFSTLANALNLAQATTSFWHNPDDLRRVLGTLARRWLGEGHEPRERLNLPAYARERGFPKHHPVILGLDSSNAARKIFHAMQEIQISQMEDLAGISRCLVKLR
jgi:hypothetical protein